VNAIPRRAFLAGFGAASLAAAVRSRAAPAPPLRVLLLAGQSDILNWHADAALLPPDPADAGIRFYYHTGAPPLHPQFPRNFFKATSRDAWTTLRPQTQEPYHKFFRTFFGPEMTLGRRLHAAGRGPLAIVKIGYFGTSLATDWHPEATEGNRLHALFHRQATHALGLLRAEGCAFRVAGFFWMQGGSDARAGLAERYEANLAAFLARVRRDFGDATTPVVLGRIPRGPASPHREIVRAATAKIGSTQPHTAWVDSDDLPCDTDGVHLLAAGIIPLGERMAAAWLRLADQKV
jgi:hypothetical protein